MVKKTPKSNAEEDRALWEKVTRSLTPLKSEKHNFAELLNQDKKQSDVKPLKQNKVKVRTYGLGPAPKQPLPKTAKAHLELGQVVDVDKSTADKLKRGRMKVDATLDLHGMTQNKAYGALSDFIARAYDKGHRCVLVVTGKGIWREGGGVLKEQVPKWLNQPGNRTKILSISHAIQRDGGSGAIYVLIKRRRQTS